VAAAFFTSPEFSRTGLYIIKVYLAAFGRTPDFGGWEHWLAAFRAGVPPLSLVNSFITSPEFAQRFGNPDNEGFVKVVYRNVLGREPDAGGLAYWKGLLDGNALTRAQLMDSFARSAEFDAAVRNRAYAMLLYLGLLRRSPEPAGLEYWAQAVGTGTPLETLTGAFIDSAEYARRFQ
jgi:hypothetical protein